VGVTTYTGDNTSGRKVTGLNFNSKPDFVWIKNRDQIQSHYLFDTVRGADKALFSDLTNQENDYSSSGGRMPSFDYNGFTVNYSSSTGTNSNGDDFVAWCWKAGGNSNTFNINDVGYDTASAAGLTAGTITPTGASVNTKSGFSIIKYNSGGSTGNYTISHGLAQTPKFIIHKSLGTSNWWVYHASVIDNLAKYLQLNSTNAVETNSANMWGGQFPDSSVLGVRVGDLIGTSTDAIMYAWAEIPGFSKFGSYTGNNSADGPAIITGFKPALVIWKRVTGGTGNWVISDRLRDSTNPIFGYLTAESSSAEERGTAILDFLSNGFKIRNTWVSINGTDTIIYAAFAETPSFNLYGGQANAR
jgi:hypothetical protein